jgi:hypothetical protein
MRCPKAAVHLFAALTLTCSTFSLAADGFSLSAGADYTTGKYGGTTSTDIWYVPFVGRYDSGPFIFKLTVPYLRITGPGNVVGPGIAGGGGAAGGGGGGGGGVFACGEDRRRGASKPEDSGSCTGSGATGTAASIARRTESGLGDVIAALTYNVFDLPSSGLAFDVTGKIKFPTASSSRGLGTGKTDYAVQTDLSKESSGGLILNVTAGYRILGDPEGIDFRNVVYGAVGAGYRVSAASTVGVDLTAAQSAVSGGRDMRDVSIYYTSKISKISRLNLYVLKGLADGSPNWGGGFTYRHGF